MSRDGIATGDFEIIGKSRFSQSLDGFLLPRKLEFIINAGCAKIISENIRKVSLMKKYRSLILAIVCFAAAIALIVTFFKCDYKYRRFRSDSNAEITWLCLGDSITVGECNHSVSYADYVGKNLENINLLNRGASGYTAFDIYSNYANLDISENPDIVTVFVGTNDWVYDVPIGNPEDRTNDTFCGRLNLLMQKIRNRYPFTRVVFFTPIYRDMQPHESIPFTGTTNSNGNTTADFAEAVILCAANHNIEILDLYNLSGINESNADKYLVDGTHPNFEGQILIAEQVETLFES